jgi:catecholate siderophore receptor
MPKCDAVGLRASLLLGTGLSLLGAGPALAADAQRASASEQITIQGTAIQDYKVDTSGITKLPAPLLDTPQTIDIVAEQVMHDRAAVTLNDALRNVPSITIGAGEFRTIGTSPTIRGFAARTDMFLDGLRDFGNYYRDPFALENVEVLEGPASILFGRGSTGGVIEQNSKLPKLGSLISGNLTFGTDETKRVVADINEPLGGLGEGAAFRLAAMGHDAGVTGRNVAHMSRYGFAPSLALGLGTPTRLIASYFHQSSDDIPDYGIPYVGATPAAVPRSNFYGFKSDFMRTGVDVATLKIEHDFSDAFTISNQMRYAVYTRNFRFTEPLIAASVPATTPLANITVTRNVNTGDGKDTMAWDQLVATFRFETGAIRHTLVAGIEGGRETSQPNFYNSLGVPTTPLLEPDEDEPFNATVTYPRFKTHLTANSMAPFALDTLTLGPFELTGGLRWDSFHASYNDINYSTSGSGAVAKTDHLARRDEKFSTRGALTYKPAANGSIYFSYGTSFNPSAEELSFITSSRSFNLSNAALAPEENENFELGTKWSVLNDRLTLTASVFRAEKDNARVPDPTNALLNVLGGDFRVDGAEVRAVGQITPAWQITAGYAYLDGKIVGTVAGGPPLGSPLMNTPKHSITFWTTYKVTAQIELGGGGRYVSAQYTQNVPPVKTVPRFWDFDAMAKYAVTQQISVQVNILNLFDKYFYDQLHFFHVVPGEGRTALFGLSYNY